MDFFEGWDAKRRPAPTTTAPVTPAVAGQATPYALAALRGEVDNIQAVPIGSGRNDQLNRSAVKMYGLAAAGQIDERTVTETLGAADGGLDFTATRRTLESAREAVFTRLGARVVPESTARPAQTTTDPFGEGHYVGPVGVADSGTGVRSAEAAAETPNIAQPDPDEAYRVLVATEARRVRLNRDARKLVDDQDAANAFRVPPFLPTLADELAIPDEPVTYAIDELIPTGANVVLTAQYKTGKTTTINNLARAFADGVDFLNRYGVAPLDGRVCLFNYEVDGAQYRRWLREVGIVNVDRVTVLNLRGFRLPLTVPFVEDWTVNYLRERECKVWIVDPFARAFTGCGDENDNGQVGVFLDTLDVIKERAGVDVLVMPNHTGRAEFEQGQERGRGATRLDDWADVRWLLTKDDSDVRYFRATGRDVDVDESALAFDPATRHLRVAGGDRREQARRRIDDAVLTIVQNRPGVGTVDLREGVVQILGRGIGRDAFTGAVTRLCGSRRMHTVKVGKTVEHHPGPSPLITAGDPFDEH